MEVYTKTHKFDNDLYCNICNSKVEEGDVFCRCCGARLDEPKTNDRYGDEVEMDGDVYVSLESVLTDVQKILSENGLQARPYLDRIRENTKNNSVFLSQYARTCKFVQAAIEEVMNYPETDKQNEIKEGGKDHE